MKKFLVLFTLLIFAISFYGQTAKSYRQVIETSDVPKSVRNEFKTRYPDAMVKMWYVTNISYWYEDYGPSQYNNWYKTRTVVVYKFNQPSNYEVEFLNDYENSRAIFNRYGAWFETRTQVYNLPDGVEKAMEYSDYATWQRSDYKERIEAPGMPGSVYRMQVSNRGYSEIIRINDTGKIVQVKSE